MDEELKLGFHRAVALLLRRPIEIWSRRWHEGRIALEERHPRFPSRA